MSNRNTKTEKKSGKSQVGRSRSSELCRGTDILTVFGDVPPGRDSFLIVRARFGLDPYDMQHRSKIPRC